MWQQNKEPVTDMLRKSSEGLVFFPRNEGEAAFIQEHFFEKGYHWERTGKTVSHEGDCVVKGMVFKTARKKIHTGPSRERAYLVCTVDQLDPDFVPPKSAEDVFNLVAKMQEELTALRREVTELRQHILPQEVEKIKLKAPKRPKTPGAARRT